MAQAALQEANYHIINMKWSTENSNGGKTCENCQKTVGKMKNHLLESEACFLHYLNANSVSTIEELIKKLKNDQRNLRRKNQRSVGNKRDRSKEILKRRLDRQNSRIRVGIYQEDDYINLLY